MYDPSNSTDFLKFRTTGAKRIGAHLAVLPGVVVGVIIITPEARP